MFFPKSFFSPSFFPAFYWRGGIAPPEPVTTGLTGGILIDKSKVRSYKEQENAEFDRRLALKRDEEEILEMLGIFTELL